MLAVVFSGRERAMEAFAPPLKSYRFAMIFTFCLSVDRNSNAVQNLEQMLCAVTGSDADKELPNFGIGRECVGLCPAAFLIGRYFDLRDF